MRFNSGFKGLSISVICTCIQRQFMALTVCYSILNHLNIFHTPTQAVVLCEKLYVCMKGVDDRV